MSDALSLLLARRPSPSPSKGVGASPLHVPRGRHVSETERVANLPAKTAADIARDNPHLRASLAAWRRPGSDWKLRDVQTVALVVLGAVRGLLAPIGVGHGKTLISILGAAIVGAERPVVMLPPSLRESFFAEYAKYSAHFYLPKVRLVAYSELSKPDGTDLLRRMAPDYIFADEAHALRHPTSARTRRLVRYLDENPSTVFAAASGTLTARSIVDYAHLAHYALGAGSPFPRDPQHLEAWSEVIDADGRATSASFDVFAPIEEWHAKTAPTSLFATTKDRVGFCRDAFQARLVSTPGVVATEDSSASCSLIIHERTVDVPADIVEALEVVKTGESPNHEDIYEDDVAQWRAARQVSCGFFYRWAWEETPRGEVDEEWLSARSEWSRFVRRELQHNAREGYDSPAWVASAVDAAIARDGAGYGGIYGARERWLKVADRPVPPTRAVWLSTFLVDAVVALVRRHRGPCLVWYESTVVGAALAAAGGWDLCGPGDPPRDPTKTSVVSIPAHNKGLNLQAWNRSIVVEPPSSAQIWEQLIGRTHRAGQPADEVFVDVFVHTPAFRDAWEAAKVRADYTSRTIGQRVKLEIATILEA